MGLSYIRNDHKILGFEGSEALIAVRTPCFEQDNVDKAEYNGKHKVMKSELNLHWEQARVNMVEHSSEYVGKGIAAEGSKKICRSGYSAIEGRTPEHLLIRI